MAKKKTSGIALPLGGHQTPAFSELQGIPFQQLCRDIIAKDASVQSCDQYGTPGKTDHGVDLVAPLKDQAGLLVAQCKAKKAFSPTLIKKASTEFFKHWEAEWSDKNIKRFILIVGCDLNDTKQQQMLITQQKRFLSYNIAYEWWSASTLVTKLQPHEEIVGRYFHPFTAQWIEYFCGQRVSQQFGRATQVSGAVSAALANQIEQLTSTIVGDTAKLLEAAIDLWKDGEIAEADKSAAALQLDTIRWTGLDALSKAEIITFRGKLALEQCDLPMAEKFVKEAASLGESAVVCNLKSLIALSKGDIAKAETEIKSCTGEDAARIRVMIMLQSGNPAKALKLLNDIELEMGGLSADALRLKALGLLLTRQNNQSLAAIDQCLSIQPKWKYSKMVSGIIRYYAALSPVEVPDYLPSWPAPTDWSMAKDNDEGRKRLQESADSFKDLLKQKFLRPEEKRQLEGWLIASLASSTATREEAQQECKRLLAIDRNHESALAWSISRKFNIDLTDSESSLRVLADEFKASIDQVISLILLYLRNNRFHDAEELLTQQVKQFEQAGAQKLWQFWQGQVLLLSDKWDDVVTLFGGVSNIPSELLPVIRNKSRESQLIGCTTSTELLGRQMLDVCISKALAGNWEFVAEKAQRLVNEIQTQQALRLASNSLFMTEQYGECITLLNSNCVMFNGQRLDHDLQLLKAECLQRLGLVNAALSTAELAVTLHPNTQNLLHYSKLLSETGNLQSLMVIVKRLSLQADLTPVQAIRLAELIYRDDPRTARKLWTRASNGKISGDYVFRAIFLGYQLGLDRDPNYIQLHRQLQRLAKSNSRTVRMLTLDDVIETITKQRKANEARARAYEEGTGPAHLLYDLPLLYHTAESSAEKHVPLLQSPVIFSIHEDRQGPYGFPTMPPAWRLTLDISSVLVADRFGFLDAAIEAFGPIHIPNETISILTWYRQRLRTLPPDRRAAIDAVLRTIDLGEIRMFEYADVDGTNLTTTQQIDRQQDVLLAHVQQEHGWFVDFTPDLKPSDNSPTAGGLPYKTDSASVLGSMNVNGRLSKPQYESALALLPKSGKMSATPVPPVGAKLFAHISILEEFAKADVLQAVTTYFDINVPTHEVRFVRGEVLGDQASQDIDDSLSSLIERLNNYIQEDKVLVLPAAGTERQNESEIVLQSLRALVELKPKINDTLWIDDRYINGYLQQENGTPIVSSWEVLKGLAVTSFGIHNYYNTLLKMRCGNIRYLPLESSEILYHLRQAPINNNQIIETEELKVISHYASSCLAQDTMLHKRQQIEGPVNFIKSLKRELLDAWVQIWIEKDAINNKIARSEWLIQKLLTDLISLSIMGWGNACSNNIATVVCEFLFTAMQILSACGADTAKHYLRWLDERLFRTLLDKDPALIQEIIGHLKQYTAVHLSQDKDEDGAIVIALLAWWYRNLPERLRDEAAKDTELMSKLGITYMTFGNIYGLTFGVDQLDRLVSDVISSGETILIDSKEVSGVKVSAQILADGRIGITFISTDRQLSVYDDEIQVLFNTPHYRRIALQRNPQWIDVSCEQVENIISKIAYLEPASARIQELQRWQDANLKDYYAQLEAYLLHRDQLNIVDFLPPSIDSMLNHYGLNNSIEFDAIRKISDSFLAQSDQFTELLAGLPVELPPAILEQIHSQSALRNRQLVKGLLCSHSPLSRIQLLKILECLKGHRAYERLRVQVRKYLISEQQLIECEAFISVLRWVGNRFSGWTNARALPWSLRLALIWLHTARLYNIFIRTSLNPEWIHETFGNARKLVSVAILDIDSSIRNDAAAIDTTFAERLLVAGLVYGLSPEDYPKVEPRLVECALAALEGGEYWPKPSLLRSPPKSNVLSSFLGLDWVEAADIVKPFEALTLPKLLELATTSIDRIRNASESYFWWLVLFHIAPQAMDQRDITEAVKMLLSEKGLYCLAKESKSASAPIVVASIHCADDPQLNAQIVSDLKKIALNSREFITNTDLQEQRDESNQLYCALVEAALILSRTKKTFEADTFIDLMIAFTRLCPEFGNQAASLVEGFWQELPVEAASQLWKLRVYMNASVTTSLTNGEGDNNAGLPEERKEGKDGNE